MRGISQDHEIINISAGTRHGWKAGIFVKKDVPKQTEEERRMIADAIAAGRVTIITHDDVVAYHERQNAPEWAVGDKRHEMRGSAEANRIRSRRRVEKVIAFLDAGDDFDLSAIKGGYVSGWNAARSALNNYFNGKVPEKYKKLHPNSWSGIDEAMISAGADLRRAGMTWHKISETLHVNESTLRDAIIKKFPDLPSRFKPTNKR